MQASVTVIHLVKKTTRTGARTTTQQLVHSISNSSSEKLRAWCKDCDGLVVARPVFHCRKCRVDGTFERLSVDPIDYHAQEIPAHLLAGTCNACKGEELAPSVIFECSACDNRPVAPLRLIRENFHHIPCIKCGLRVELLVKFPCSSGHCICQECFSNMCKQQLGVDRFQQFPDLGFSIHCPGPGEDCKASPVLDPHHFRIAGEVFYKKFTEKAMETYVPSGDNILCKCKTEIDMTQGKPVPVEPAEPEAAVSGLRWYQRWFKSQPKKPSPKPTRRRASCSKCDVAYCLGCKQVWHEGNCVPVTKEMEEEEKSFPIEPDKAQAGRWPDSKEN